MVWLGLEKHQDAWNDRSGTEGDFCVYAETVSIIMDRMPESNFN